MVMLRDDGAAPGEHAVTPEAVGRSTGFIPANGQHDEYLDEDTVPLPDALRIIDHILTTGAPPGGTTWSVAGEDTAAPGELRDRSPGNYAIVHSADATEIQVRRPAAGRGGRRAFVSGSSEQPPAGNSVATAAALRAQRRDRGLPGAKAGRPALVSGPGAAAGRHSGLRGRGPDGHALLAGLLADAVVVGSGADEFVEQGKGQFIE